MGSAARQTIKVIFVIVAFTAALPFIVLSAMGAMRPAEGFCLENGFDRNGGAPTSEEEDNSFFNSPELAAKSAEVFSDFSWPACIRSRRGLHRSLATVHDRQLTRLGEPDLKQLHSTNRSAEVLRVLTAPSFSRLPIAFRVQMNADGTGLITSTWLEDDGVEFNESHDPNGYDAWRNASLPRRTLQRHLESAQIRELRALLAEVSPGPTIMFIFDGNWFVIEHVDNGQRSVSVELLSSGARGRFFCRLVELSAISRDVVVAGDLHECADGE
jgi:hypothetical protein